jgi:hypothetical protein
MTTHFAWARVGRSWRLVATGASAAEAHRALLAWIKQQARPPIASAVLPQGVHPAAGAGGPGVTEGGPNVTRPR